ncbi:MAG: hypothetical protein AAGD92_00710 [Pseudomonadota bacterium]
MKKKTASKIRKKPFEDDTDPAVLSAYRKMLAAVPGVEWKGAARPYTSLNGNMYSAISKADIIGLRLSAADREIFLEKYGNGLYEPFPGFFQKEYVAIPEKLLANTRTLRSWFRKSYEHVASLKPKPTKKPKNNPR